MDVILRSLFVILPVPSVCYPETTANKMFLSSFLLRHILFLLTQVKMLLN